MRLALKELERAVRVCVYMCVYYVDKQLRTGAASRKKKKTSENRNKEGERKRKALKNVKHQYITNWRCSYKKSLKRKKKT